MSPRSGATPLRLWLALGVALTVGSSPLAVSAWVLSSQTGWAELPPAPDVTVASTWTRNVCYAQANGVCSSGGTVDVGGVSLIAPGNRWLISVFPTGPIIALSESGRAQLSAVRTACAPSTPLYPGSGDIAVIECLTGMTSGYSTTFGNVTILVYNWRTSNVTEQIPLNSPFACAGGMTMDEVRGLIYCPGGNPVSFLRTVSLAKGAVVANFSLPGNCSFPCAMVFDPGPNLLLYGNFPDHALIALDPVTGRTTGRLALPGLVDKLGLDPSGGMLWLGLTTGPSNNPYANITTVNVSSMHLGPLWRTPLLGQSPFLFDPSHHEVYVRTSAATYAFNDSTGQVVATFAPGWFQSAYDPATDTILEIASGGTPSAYVVFTNLSHSPGRSAPLSAVPLLGSNLPLAVGLLGTIAGAGLLVARRIRVGPRRPPREELFAEREDSRPAEAGPEGRPPS